MDIKNFRLKIVRAIILSMACFVCLAKSPSKIELMTDDSESKKVSEDVINNSSGDLELKKHSVGIGIGQTFLRGDFKETGGDEVTLDLLYNYIASYSFDLHISAHYSKHESELKETTLSGIAIGFKGKFFNYDNFSPYFLAGLGLYSPKVKRYILGELKESKSKLIFGNHFGVGADLILNKRMTIGLMAHIHNPFDVKQDSDPDVEGSYTKLLVTTAYSF